MGLLAIKAFENFGHEADDVFEQHLHQPIRGGQRHRGLSQQHRAMGCNVHIVDAEDGMKGLYAA